MAYVKYNGLITPKLEPGKPELFKKHIEGKSNKVPSLKAQQPPIVCPSLHSLGQMRLEVSAIPLSFIQIPFKADYGLVSVVWQFSWGNHA